MFGYDFLYATGNSSNSEIVKMINALMRKINYFLGYYE